MEAGLPGSGEANAGHDPDHQRGLGPSQFCTPEEGREGVAEHEVGRLRDWQQEVLSKSNVWRVGHLCGVGGPQKT